MRYGADKKKKEGSCSQVPAISSLNNSISQVSVRRKDDLMSLTLLPPSLKGPALLADLKWDG